MPEKRPKSVTLKIFFDSAFFILCAKIILEMNFYQSFRISYGSARRLLLLLTLFALTQSLPTLNITDSEGREYRDITLHIMNETFPATIKCSSEAEWRLQPDLPKGLSMVANKEVLTIVGRAKVSLPKTTFTVTAITQEGEASITFSLTCTGCEDGNMYNLFVHGHIRFSYQQEIVDIYSEGWQCFKNAVYTYTSLQDNSYITVRDVDDNYVLYFSSINNTDSGEIDFSNNSPPVLFFPDAIKSTDDGIMQMIPFSFANRVTNITLYPPHPLIRVTPTDLTVSITNYYESNHILTLSNEHGSDSKSFHLIIRGCNEGQYYNVVHLSWGDTIVVDSKNNTVYNGMQNYFCAADNNLTLYFDKSRWGLELMRPIFLYDRNGVVAEYNTDSVPTTFHFYKQDLVSAFSSLRISRSFQNNWNSKAYDDSNWKEDRGQMWGSFEGDGVYFRRKFSIESIENFNTMLIDILALGEVDVYLNGEYVKHLFGKSYNSYTRFEIPLEESHIGENVLAAYLLKTTDDIIHFDIMVQLTVTTQILQSMLGEVTQETATPSPNPFHAFIQSGYYEWLLQSVPSSLVFRFNDTEKRVVNRVYFQVPRDNYITKVKVEAIDFSENRNITLYSSPNDFMNRFMKYRIVDFDNSVAYPAYRITFESTSNSNTTNIENLRLYRDMIPSCPQTKKYPETRGNKTIFTDCGLFYTGKQQNRCAIDGSKTHWEEDRSTCLSLLPNRNYAYVDFTLRLVHVIPSMFNSTMQEQLTNVLIETTAARPEEIEFIYIMDSSDTVNSNIDIYMRITVKLTGGDYIAEQLNNIKYDLSDPIHNNLAEEIDGMIIGKIHVYLSWKPEIVILILILLIIELILVVLAAYGVSAYIRNRKQKTKSLKRRKMNEEELLTNQEWIVCFRLETLYFLAWKLYRFFFYCPMLFGPTSEYLVRYVLFLEKPRFPLLFYP